MISNQFHNRSLYIVLFEPRIPHNTGSIARTCVAFNLPLVLIAPLGFSLENRYLKRAGLDYWPYVDLSVFNCLDDFLIQFPSPKRLIGCSKSSDNSLDKFSFQYGDILLFGREDIGLPDLVRETCHHIVSIPMVGAADDTGKGGVRSFNLSVASAIIAYEAVKQLHLLI